MLKRILPIFPMMLVQLVLATPNTGDLEITRYEFEARNGETVGAELGAFRVPENRRHPESRMITLRFVRFASTAEEPGAPIVYLAGGPGGSGIDTARGSRFQLFMALREYGDVIAFDQRGTGMSEADLSCAERHALPLDEPLDGEKASANLAAVARQCVERLRSQGIDVSGYNTAESAADLDDLRRALGAEKLTLWGISYGTHLALATMKAFGERIDRAILAGVEGLHHTLKLPSDQQALMEVIAGLAAADPVTKAHTPDLLGSIRRLLDELGREPRRVAVTDPRSGAAMPIVVGAEDLKVVLADMLRGPESFATMPDFVHRLEQGDWLALALMSAGQRLGSIPDAMTLAMDCASGASREWRARIAREAGTTLLGDAINSYMPDICAGVGVPDLGDAFREPVKSEIPTLLISGTLDGRTPVSNGREVERHLENAHHLIIEGAGHSDPLFLSSAKILESMEALLNGRKPPYERIGLERPVRFVAPRTVVEVGEEVLDPYVGDYEIAPGDIRTVIRAGNLLFTSRRGGRPLPIRPMGEREFFYEGEATWLRFDVDEDGAVTGMTVFHNGAAEGEPARRIRS